MFEAAYIKLHQDGKLKKLADALYGIYDHCELCPRKCGVNRNKGQRGVCGAGAGARISSAHPHFGEERPLVGMHGSGTIFLSHCNLLCLYCQNWEISHKGEGQDIGDEELADVMIRLQDIGCHNINFVTPTHFLPNIVNALVYAVDKGLRLPIVYNTGGYDSLEILKMLDGVIDIYLPDYKYSSGTVAAKFSRGVSDYPEVVRAALKEMHRQVGILKTDKYDVALRGVMIRHLVLPNDLSGTPEFAKFVSGELSRSTYVNIMAQYRPCYQANKYPEISSSLQAHEFRRAVATAQNHGLFNLD